MRARDAGARARALEKACVCVVLRVLACVRAYEGTKALAVWAWFCERTLRFVLLRRIDCARR